MNTRHTPKSFYAKAEKQEGGCWIWTGSTNKAGYGQLGYGGKRTTAHRLSYELAKGEIPAGMVVRHTCDNPPCCNPDHLILGTHQDNMNDKTERGRHRGPVGTPSLRMEYKTVDQKNAEKYGRCACGTVLIPKHTQVQKNGTSICAHCHYKQKAQMIDAPLTQAEQAVVHVTVLTIKALLGTLSTDSRTKVAIELIRELRDLLSAEL